MPKKSINLYKFNYYKNGHFYKMRITLLQKECINQTARIVFGEGVKVMLFGSRLDDSKKGGDIDLIVIPKKVDKNINFYEMKIEFLIQLKKKLGDRKIDVVIKGINQNESFIQNIMRNAVIL